VDASAAFDLPVNIFITVAGLDPEQRRRLESALAGHSIRHRDAFPDEAAARLAVADSHVVFGNVPAGWLVSARNVRWVQLDSAGVDAYLKLNAERAGAPVLLTNLRDFYGTAVAEATLAGILAFYRQLPRLLVAQHEGRWIKRELEGAAAIRQLHGASVILLGAGAIGRKIADLLRPFEGKIQFFARSAPEATLRSPAELDAALPAADIVINTLPHTPGTIGLLGAERLARFHPAALLVNVGRGSVLDETALLAALNAGRLGGAVLDVTSVEPLPAGHPFWAHPRVLLTQHTGGRFPGEAAAKVTRFLENFGRFSRGEPLVGVLDAARGY
jgi:phosphoglycerate dehydrogenase-like enzyme